MEGLPESARVQPWTSGTARVLGEELDVSPIKIDHAIKGVFGGLGMQAVHQIDKILAMTQVIPEEQIGGQGVIEAITSRFFGSYGGRKRAEAFEEFRPYTERSNLRSNLEWQAANKLFVDPAGNAGFGHQEVHPSRRGECPRNRPDREEDAPERSGPERVHD
jgi:hypothetical protein